MKQMKLAVCVRASVYVNAHVCVCAVCVCVCVCAYVHECGECVRSRVVCGGGVNCRLLGTCSLTNLSD